VVESKGKDILDKEDSQVKKVVKGGGTAQKKRGSRGCKGKKA